MALKIPGALGRVAMDAGQRALAVLAAFALIGSALLALSGIAVEPVRAQTIDSSRLVTIGGSITEIVYALDLQSRIAGVDTTSVYPAQALHDLPNVGYMRNLSAEGILSLKPSAVIAVDGSGPPAALKLVADAGVPVVGVHDDPTPEGVVAKIEKVGALLGEAQRASALANEVRARFALLEPMRQRVAKPSRVLFVLSLANGKPMVGGRGTAADAIIHLAGAVNAAADIDGYKPMTDEALIASAPDVVLKMTNGAMVGSADDVFSLPAFAATPAAAKRALIGMDGVYLLGFGPRTPDAARDLMASLYPDLALPPLPALAERQ